MAKTLTVKAPAVKVPATLQKKIAAQIAVAESLPVIDSREHYAAAMAKLRDLKTEHRALTEMFEEARRPLNEARAKAIDLQKTLLGPLAVIIDAIDSRCLAFEREVEATRRAAEHAARMATEAQAKADRDAQVRKLQEAAAARPDLAQQAEALARMPLIPVPTQAVAHKAPLAALGGHRKKTYRAEVQDFPALIMAVAAPLFLAQFEERLQEAVAGAPFDEATADLLMVAEMFRALLGAAGAAETRYLEPDLPALHDVMRACGGESPVPGVVAVEQTSKAVLR